MNSEKIIRSITAGILYTLTAVAAFLFQGTFLPAAGMRIPVYLLMPLTAVVAVYNKDFAGLFFGVLTGSLFDLCSSAPDGSYTLYFALFGLIAGGLSRKYFRTSLNVMLILSASGTFLLCVIGLLIGIISSGAGNIRHIITGFYIPSFVVTVLTTPVFRLIIGSFEKIKYERE